MGYELKRDGSDATLKIQGHLDIKTSPEIDKWLGPQLDDVSSLTIDLAQVDFVSSMGLRLLLSLQKRMSKQGSMRVTNTQEQVMDLFDKTGFDQILTLE
jgi:anti-sigma B factor antagonist